MFWLIPITECSRVALEEYHGEIEDLVAYKQNSGHKKSRFRGPGFKGERNERTVVLDHF